MQVNLFGEVIQPAISIENAAIEANVSSATIRNWIKTGYLEKAGKGAITESSLNKFMEEVAGSEKLNSRANKLQKDSHDHQSLGLNIFSNKKELAGSELGAFYEESLSNSHRNKEGVYYTPSDIIDDMLEGLPIVSSSLFLDPCCGSGNFIIQAIRKGVGPENIYGYDIDPNAVEICQKRFFEETGYRSPNIKVADFLEIASKSVAEASKFDFIFTNPPWGKKFQKEKKQKFASQFGAGKSIDTSSLFFFAALRLLKESGYLGFLVQEALFNISNFEDARKTILKLRLKRLANYGKVFSGVQTNAQAFILQKGGNNSDNRVECFDDSKKYKRSIESFLSNPKQILNFWAVSTEAKVIDRFFSVPHETLKDKAKWGLGIVTGNNTKFIEPKPKKSLIPVFKGSDITQDGLKPPSHYISSDFSQYQQVAPLELYQADHKLIYKFISSKLVFFHDTAQRYILNSANLVIPNDHLRVTPDQLCRLFNSEIENWIYSKVFKTHKVLRGDLESLPIHSDYFIDNSTFDETKYLEMVGIQKDNYGSYRIKA